MDFVEIDLTKIKALCIIQPVKDSDNIYKSIFDSFDRFCQSKKLNSYI